MLYQNKLKRLLNNGYLYRERILNQACENLGFDSEYSKLIINWICSRGGTTAQNFQDKDAIKLYFEIITVITIESVKN